MMKSLNILILILSITGLSLSSTLIADVYKQTDKEGNVIFTDKPKGDAEKVDVEPVNVHNYPEPKQIKPLPTKEKEKPPYNSISIIAPANDTTVRDPGDVLVRAELRPTLRRFHQVRFIDNGKALEAASRSLSLQLYNLSRGTHLVQVEVLDRKGATLMTSEAIAIHVHRHSIIPKTAVPPTPNPNNNP